MTIGPRLHRIIAAQPYLLQFVNLSGTVPFMISRGFSILLIASLLVGCSRWDSKPGHYIQGTNAVAGVSAFISKYGWNMSTNDADLWSWEALPPRNIGGLPWSKYKGKKFPALTRDGILYVLSNPGWHHDYGGVAYNPSTNRFPDFLEGFEPIGNHWYVWCITEFQGYNLPKKYE